MTKHCGTCAREVPVNELTQGVICTSCMSGLAGSRVWVFSNRISDDLTREINTMVAAIRRTGYEPGQLELTYSSEMLQRDHCEIVVRHTTECRIKRGRRR